MFVSVVTAMLLNTTGQMLFSAPKKTGTASYVQEVYGAWFALYYPSCLLGMPAIPQAMPGILWEGADGYRPQLYHERHCQFNKVHS